MPINIPPVSSAKSFGVLIAMSLCVTVLADDDSPRQQLDRLRTEHRYDAAIDYLEKLRDAPDTPEDLKQVVLFEMGATHAEAASRDREPIRRRSRLDAAAFNCRAFIESHPNHVLTVAARGKLASVLVEMARFSFAQTQNRGLDAPDNQPFLEEARNRFSEASALYKANQAELQARLTEIKKTLDPKDPEQRKQIDLRSRYRADYLQASLLIPAIAEEQAGTYPAEAKVRGEILQDAAAAYGDIFRRYRTLLAGLYARMYEGRCYLKLGQGERALKVFDELLMQPDGPVAFRMLKQRVAVLAAECWLDDSQKDYQRAIGKLDELLESFSADQSKTPDALELRFALAKAHQRFAKQIAEDSPDDPRIAASRRQAVAEARLVALQSTRHRTAASELLAELGVESPLGHAEIGEVTTFAELSSLGRQSMDRWQLAMIESLKLTARIKSESDVKIKEELQQRLDRANKTSRSAQDQTLAAYQRALEMTDDEPIENVIQVRYFTCYVLYTKEKYRKAAEIGERLAKEYPENSIAIQVAQITFASYLRIHNTSASNEDRALARKQLSEFGSYILKHWDDQPVGENVRQTLQRLEQAPDCIGCAGP